MTLNFKILSVSPSKRKQSKTSPTINQEKSILMPTIFAPFHCLNTYSICILVKLPLENIVISNFEFRSASVTRKEAFKGTLM